MIGLYYASRDGQARRIAERIRRRLSMNAEVSRERDLARDPPDAAELARLRVAVLIAAVRYGSHLSETQRFFLAYDGMAVKPALALASVNLTARKVGKTDAQGNAYLRKLIARHRLAPAVATAFAGRLDYRRYRWSDRQIIRFIMWLTGGPTGADTAVEYTDWDAVDRFADAIAGLPPR